MTFKEVHKTCKPFTMTCKERMRALYDAIYEIEEKGIPGDLIEVGVWKGGNLMLMALVLNDMGSDRRVWGFDTFEGMPELGEFDVNYDGTVPDFSRRNNLAVSIEDVKRVLSTVPYLVKLVKGKIEDTIVQAPNQIALLRIDTDLYSSTRKSLELWDKVPKGGVLIDDDYYRFKGAKLAIDEVITGFERIGKSNAIILTKH